MCVVALALHQHPDWPIVLIGNRDEFHARESAALHDWDDGSGIIAGRDLVGGGSWLGVNPARGRLVVVTNVRGALPDPAKSSRGLLVRDLLTGSGAFADPEAAMLDGFNAFNAIAFGRGEAQLLGNRHAPFIMPLKSGVHALANAPAHDDCPRAARLGSALQDWLAKGEAQPTALLDLVRDEDQPALFLRNTAYGTRCSTLVAIAADGTGQMIERRYGEGGIPMGETALSFRFHG